MKPVRYPEDCKRIVETAYQLGYDCTLKQAEELWEKHSDDHCAGWLGFLDREEVVSAIRRYFGNE